MLHVNVDKLVSYAEVLEHGGGGGGGGGSAWACLILRDGIGSRRKGTILGRERAGEKGFLGFGFVELAQELFGARIEDEMSPDLWRIERLGER